MRALTHLRSPGLILLFPWAQEYSGLGLVAAAAQAARDASVPIAVHLDHAQSATAVRFAADSGLYDSIMVDMSHCAEKAENLTQTADLTGYCKSRGVAVEAEPGRIEGGEDGVADTSAAGLQAMMTDADEALRFVNTGIDWLAPSFGNVHGKYGPNGIELDYARLESIRRAIGPDVRLVLHGTDGFDADILKRCISAGIVKVNINRSVNDIWRAVVSGEGAVSVLMEKATEGMQKEIERWIYMLGSEGKALDHGPA